MKTKPKKATILFSVATLAFFCAASQACGDEQGNNKKIKLSSEAIQHARNLIKNGEAVADHHGAWAKHQPSSAEENEFIRRYGFSEYAKWHLGIDEKHAENSKARYKFPYGDFKSIHRCALLAVQSRARQHGYAEIENAAAELIQLLPE